MGNDDTKRLILARRARFVAAALASVAASVATSGGLAVGLEGCGGSTEQTDAGAADGGEPQPCLKVGPRPCLEPPVEPRPCLTPPRDVDAAPPQPCLSPLPPDGGNPRPCLSMPPPDAGDEK